MIRYRLTCSNGHSFDSWFASSSAFDKLSAAGQVVCVHCGATDVRKSLMAPQVRTDAATPPETALREMASPHTSQPETSLTDTTPTETALAKLRAEVEAKSEHVGARFAEEARAIHLGDAPERQIHGEANPQDARALIEDGVPILPLPFAPRSKVN